MGFASQRNLFPPEPSSQPCKHNTRNNRKNSIITLLLFSQLGHKLQHHSAIVYLGTNRHVKMITLLIISGVLSFSARGEQNHRHKK